MKKLFGLGGALVRAMPWADLVPELQVSKIV
jgi:hypothetical protein